MLLGSSAERRSGESRAERENGNGRAILRGYINYEVAIGFGFFASTSEGGTMTAGSRDSIQGER